MISHIPWLAKLFQKAKLFRETKIFPLHPASAHPISNSVEIHIASATKLKQDHQKSRFRLKKY